MRFGLAIAGPLLMAAAGAGAQILEFSGDASLQARWYPESPAFPGQRSSTGGLVVEPTLYGDIAPSASLTVTALYRYDSADSRRTHADVREAYFLTHGDWGENSWELRLGLDRVFWGVAELHNLVDVVNQLDLVEHPRDRPKLGQPMVHLTVSGDWGIAESFLLPYHRKRTFPGRAGRLRSSLPIDEDGRYESGAEERHVDLAFRYSHSVGLLDFGLSAFVGTSREPSFLLGRQYEPSSASDAPAIPAPGWDEPVVYAGWDEPVPYYEQIRQFGLDAQLTTEPWLYKMEAVYRSGAVNLLGQEEDYSAFIFGMERTVYALFGSAADLTFLAEWLYDDRGSRATSVWANDLFVAGFLAFNDVRGTELVAGLLGDLRHDYRALSIELKRRLSDSWSVRVEVIANLRVDPQDLTYDGRRDSFLGAGLTFSF
ncbi:MAG: hypothetical protein OXK76_15180 [Gammaproteobacteria bacterium]|nr:hypothetical protein [Gammaproteobacteria bacterium]